MTTIRFIGDCHGNWHRYKNIVNGTERSVVVGDMGVGFFRWDWHEGKRIPTSNPPYDFMVRHNAQFIRGNHDNPEVCKKQSQCIPDGTIEIINGTKVMFIGGALSVDKQWRTEGLDYWSDEELSYLQLQEFINLYEIEQPDIMVTHELPESMIDIVCALSGRNKFDIPSRTRVAFQVMMDIKPPKLWLHGHHHISYYKDFKDTGFRGLGELEFIDLNFG